MSKKKKKHAYYRIGSRVRIFTGEMYAQMLRDIYEKQIWERENKSLC